MFHCFCGATCASLFFRRGVCIFVSRSGLCIFVSRSGLCLFVSRSGLCLFVSRSGLCLFVSRSGLCLLCQPAVFRATGRPSSCSFESHEAPTPALTTKTLAPTIANRRSTRTEVTQKALAVGQPATEETTDLSSFLLD